MNFSIRFIALYYVTFQCGHKNIFRKYLKKNFAHKKLKKHPKKLHTYSSWEVFFSAASPAQNSPELYFRFINFFIQPSLLESLITPKYTLNVLKQAWFFHNPKAPVKPITVKGRGLCLL